MNENKIQAMIVGIRKTLEDVFRKMDEIELQLQDIMGELKIEDPVEREYRPARPKFTSGLGPRSLACVQQSIDVAQIFMSTEAREHCNEGLAYGASIVKDYENPIKKIVGGPEAMKKIDTEVVFDKKYKWDLLVEVAKELDIGDMMMKGGGTVLPKSSGIPLPDIDVDLPDEMFEDMLHAEVRNKAGKTWGKVFCFDTGLWVDKTQAPSLGSFVDPGDLLKDLAEFLDEEPVTEPMVAVPAGMSDPKTLLRDQRKKEGVCPDCGDVKNETAVGICSLHGKFLG